MGEHSPMPKRSKVRDPSVPGVWPGGAAPGLFRDLCENANDLIQSVSPEGRLLYVNRAWRETLGFGESEIAGLDVIDVVHPDSRDHCRAALREVMSGKTLGDLEFAFRTKDGRRVEVSGSARSWFENGQPLATSGIFRQVTAEKHLKEERDRLFELSLDLLCVAGTDGYFKQVNPAFERVLGYSREELLSRSFLDFVHPDDRARTLEAIAVLAQGHPVVDFKNRYRARDGSYHWLAWRSAPLSGTHVVYAVARDFTEERQAQEVIVRQAEALARSNADLEQFVYAASHDLRAPLRTIGQLADWIEEQVPGEGTEKIREYLALLRQRVGRMETLIGDLLEYHRAEHAATAPIRVDTTSLVRNLATLLAPPDEFRIHAEPGLPVFEAPRAPLELVLRNLISNAIKHHDRRDGRVSVSGRRLDGFYEFVVADDGPGIPRDHQERIFGMFQQLKPRDRLEGSGIGLALVRKIVVRHGGAIRVVSDGRGAAFHFTWPAVPPSAADDEHDPGR